MNRVDNALDFQATALRLRAQRQEVLAGNIANADTPNYKARDFDFAQALQAAVAGRTGGHVGGLPMTTTAPGHLPGNVQAGTPRLLYRTPSQDAVDGNTVDMDQERTAFAETAFHYEASLNFINRLLKGMRTAITGQ